MGSGEHRRRHGLWDKLAHSPLALHSPLMPGQTGQRPPEHRPSTGKTRAGGIRTLGEWPPAAHRTREGCSWLSAQPQGTASQGLVAALHAGPGGLPVPVVLGGQGGLGLTLRRNSGHWASRKGQGHVYRRHPGVWIHLFTEAQGEESTETSCCQPAETQAAAPSWPLNSAVEA